MTKILILDIGNGMNKGNLALLYSAMETIGKFVPGVEFVLMYFGNTGSHSNTGLKEQHVIGKIRIRKPRDTLISLLHLLKCTYIWIFNKFGVHIPISKNSRLFEYYDSDIVVEIGGDTMSPSGKYNINTLTPFTNILYAILLGKPVVLYGESIGYYNNPVINSIAKFIFNKIKLILLREELSKKYVDDNGINTPKIYVTADSAFLLNPAPQSRVFEILSEEGIGDIQRPIIGINASKLISSYMGVDNQKAEEKISNTMARIIDNLVETLNANIIMIPHVYEPGTDDRVAISSIFHNVKNKSKVKVIKNEYTPQELKGIIGQCDLFIGARMHTTIASTSMLVPTVGIAYSHKMYGIIGEMLGQEKYVLDIKELNYESLISKINDAWENREKIRKELEVKIPEIKQKAMLNGKFVKELLDSLKTS